LFFHHAVIDNLKARYAECKNVVEKRKWRKLMMGKIVRKCKLQMHCREVFGFSHRRFECNVPVVNKGRGVQSKSAVFLKRAILDYYQRDDVAWLSRPGSRLPPRASVAGLCGRYHGGHLLTACYAPAH